MKLSIHNFAMDQWGNPTHDWVCDHLSHGCKQRELDDNWTSCRFQSQARHVMSSYRLARVPCLILCQLVGRTDLRLSFISCIKQFKMEDVPILIVYNIMHICEQI